MARRVTRQGTPISISIGRNMVRGLALSVAFCVSMTGGLVVTTAAHADVCKGKVVSHEHTKAHLGFKVDRSGHWLKGWLWQKHHAEKNSGEQIRGFCMPHWED